MSKTFLENRERFRAALVRSLLTGVDPGDLLPSSTLVFVNDRLARIGGIARIGVLGVECLLSAAFAVAGGAQRARPAGDTLSEGATTCVGLSEYALGLDTPRATALLRRLDVTTLPAVADYVRLVRSLALLFVFETRPIVERRHS
jgi:hypothetical protein